jgi:methionyl-tRNA formyltransferase
MMSLKKFVFFGTPYVARDTLAYLFENGYIPALVITAPDAPRGRGMVMTPCETKAWALEHGLPVITPEKLTPEVVEELRKVGADYALVVAYGKFLPQSLLDAFPLGAINVHYSLLPSYRGASPVEAALLNGDTRTGVAIQKMAKEMDAGDVLAVQGTDIEAHETTRELRARLIRIGSELLVRILPEIEAGTVPGTPQDHAAATFAKKINKSEGELDLTGDATTNWRKYRAYAERPGTYFFMEKNGTRIRVKIKTATFEDGKFIPLRVVPEGKNETDYSSLA